LLLCKVKLNILGHFVGKNDVDNSVENVQNLDFQRFVKSGLSGQIFMGP